MRSALAYSPRPNPLCSAGAGPAIAYLGALAAVALVAPSPIVIAGAGAGVLVAGLGAEAGRALAFAARLGLLLGALIVAINALVTRRGETVLVRGFELPALGPIDVTLEALAAGGVVGLRIAVVTMAFAVYSASVDPDKLLRLLRPLARRSALTATLVTRMVPLAAADHARLREAARLRGPAAAPAGRAALARRLLAGSLERAIDVAATLELRGYALGPRRSRLAAIRGGRPSRHDPAFLAAAAAVAALGAAAAIGGIGGFEAYPRLAVEAGAATLGVAAALPVLAALPFAAARRGGLPRGRRRAEHRRAVPSVAVLDGPAPACITQDGAHRPAEPR